MLPELTPSEILRNQRMTDCFAFCFDSGRLARHLANWSADDLKQLQSDVTTFRDEVKDVAEEHFELNGEEKPDWIKSSNAIYLAMTVTIEHVLGDR